MPREIKFRAWDKNNKKMLDRVLAGPGDPCSIVWNDERKEWLCFDEFCGDVMQYTGLKDRKGQEIYESDIIHRSSIGIPMLVRWNDKEARFDLSLDPLNFDAAVLWHTQACQDDYEIVGNIYEHGHLLERVLKELNRAQ